MSILLNLGVTIMLMATEACLCVTSAKLVKSGDMSAAVAYSVCIALGAGITVALLHVWLQ